MTTDFIAKRVRLDEVSAKDVMRIEKTAWWKATLGARMECVHKDSGQMGLAYVTGIDQSFGEMSIDLARSSGRFKLMPWRERSLRSQWREDVSS